MGVDLEAGDGCLIEEVVGDLYTRKLRASETHLILVKLQVDELLSTPDIMTTDPDQLMAGLENDLGDALTRYLTVQLTYKHSGFTEYDLENPTLGGTFVHATFMQTEAKVAIKRHNPQSAWSPRSSQTIPSSSETNPLTRLIETHLPEDQGIQALARINSDRTTIPFTRQHSSTGTLSDETVKPIQNEISARIDSAVLAPLNQTPSTDTRYSHTITGPFARMPLAHVRQDGEDNDPARQIWASMRRASQGGRYRHPRKSISADHYNGFDDGCNPGRFSSSQSSLGVLRCDSFDGGSIDSGIELERNMIKEVALRNKRSVGTETLRSIAPSVARTIGKGKPGTFGLGLGVGRWGWGPPWW